MAFPILPVLDIVGKAIDRIIPDQAQRDAAKIRMMEMANAGELQELQSSTQIMLAEMSGSWLQRNWRPISMLVFLALIVLDLLGITRKELPPEVWSLFQLAFGGYIVGRSAEKIVDRYKQ